MDALYCGQGGQELKDSRFPVYGWIEPGGNVSTSHTRFNFPTGTCGNYPAAHCYAPNTVQLDQAALRRGVCALARCCRRQRPV